MWTNETFQILLIATGETLLMTLASTLLAVILGLPLGLIVTITAKHHILPMPLIHRIFSLIINLGRSIPFVILMIAVLPITRILMGTTIGLRGAIFPLALSGAPFFARVVQGALATVPYGLIEAGRAMGARRRDILFKILLPESSQALIAGVMLLLINLLGYTAIAGAMGGGGLGDVANRYGYQRFEIAMTLYTVILLVLLVQITEWLGNKWQQRYNH
jgi:D-methionine transport system permease protein